MRTIYVITGSQNKAAEYARIFSDVPDIRFEQKSIDLDELQELDTRKIIEHKLKEAARHVKGEFIIDDVSFGLGCLNGFPGPLIKWVQQAIGDEGIYELVKKYPDHSAAAKCTIGYCNSAIEPNVFEMFETEAAGKIVELKEGKGHKFGFDRIFMPEGHDRRFSEMEIEEKNRISHRGKAAEKLKKFLKLKNRL